MRSTIAQGDSIDLLARVTLDDGSYPAIASITAVTIAVRNTTMDQITLTQGLAGADVVTSVPVRDDRWKEDDIGHTLSISLADTVFPFIGNYRVEVTITRDDGGITPLVWEVQVV